MSEYLLCFWLGSWNFPCYLYFFMIELFVSRWLPCSWGWGHAWPNLFSCRPLIKHSPRCWARWPVQSSLAPHPVAITLLLSFPDTKALKQHPFVGKRDFKVQKLQCKTAATYHLSNETEFISVSKCVHSSKTFWTFLFQELVSVNYFFFHSAIAEFLV